MNRRVLLVAAAATAVAVIAWFVLLWGPQGRELDDAASREATARSANSQLELRIERLRDLRARRPQLRADLRALEGAVPESPELADFFLAADDAASRAGVDLTSVSPSKPGSDEAGGTSTAAATPTTVAEGAPASPTAISLAVAASGGYFQVLDFLNRIDDLPRVVVVDTLSLAGGGQGDAAGEGGGVSPSQLTMNITARMFTTAVPEDPNASGPQAGTGTSAGATTTTAPTGAQAGGTGR